MESHKIPWFQSPPTSYSISQIWTSSWRKIGTLQQWQDPHFSPLFWEGALGHIKGMGLKRYLSSSKICLSGGRGPWARGFSFCGTNWAPGLINFIHGKKKDFHKCFDNHGMIEVEMTNQHSEDAPLALTICLELHLSQNKCSTWNLLALVKGVRAKVEQKIYKGTFSQCPCKHLSMGLCKRKRGWDAFAIAKTAAPDPS